MTTTDTQPRSKTVLYARVSPLDRVCSRQKRLAEEEGFEIDEVVIDEGASCVSKVLAERPGGRRLFDLLRAGDTLLVRWVDVLGRGYSEVCNTIRHFMGRGVVVRTVIGDLTFDGSTEDLMAMAVRDALIAFMAAIGEAQAEDTREARRAGIEHAKAADDGRYKGRKPSYSRVEFHLVQALLSKGAAISAIAKSTGLSRQTIYRIKLEPAAAEAALCSWNM